MSTARFQPSSLVIIFIVVEQKYFVLLLGFCTAKRDNAIDSFDEALERYQNVIDGNPKAYKYAVLSLSHFIELSFKYFISKINPILIYKNPFAEKLDKSHTISMWEAVNFLINLEGDNFLQISTDNELEEKNISKEKTKKYLRWLKDLRNEIEHGECLLKKGHIENIFGKCSSILNSLYRERNEYLRTFINPKFLPLYTNLINGYLERRRNAIKKSENMQIQLLKDYEGPYLDHSLTCCPSCGEKTFVLLESLKEYQCTMCNNKEEAEECFNCGAIYPLGSLSEWNDQHNAYICDFCENDIRNKD